MHTLVICRRDEAAQVLRQIASSTREEASFAVIPRPATFGAIARRTRLRTPAAPIVFVIEDQDMVPAMIHHSAVLRPPHGGRFSLEAFRTSALAAAAYSEAFGRAVRAAHVGYVRVQSLIGQGKGTGKEC